MNRHFDTRSENSSAIGWGSAEVFYIVEIDQGAAVVCLMKIGNVGDFVGNTKPFVQGAKVYVW